jgi:peptidoglycan/LPS O-acetylase OafA/YrhL
MGSQLHYRAEIDGLRALAVIPVILFHAGFEIFSGGFVGVDVFFVISGYLITSILLSEISQDKFSLINFYERRARRILPVLFFVMLLCLPLAWLILMPRDLKEFGHSLLAVSSFSSNILFWFESDYFDTAAELKPLLHTWSLAVEEQYYILFPLFLMFVWKLGKQKVIALLSIIFIVSFLVACLAPIIINHPKIVSGNFYLLPSRGWELLIGAFAAFYLQNNPPANLKGLNQVLSLLGLLLIVFANFFFTKETPFPGVYALVPTVGAVLIILFANKGTLVHQLLSVKLFVGVGLISYSAYLWHQPIFAFINYSAEAHLSSLSMFGVCIVVFPLAYLSWKYIETPLRNKQLFSRKYIFTGSAVGCLLFMVIGLVIHNADGFKGRLTAQQLSILEYQQYPRAKIYRQGSCFILHSQEFEDFSGECESSIPDLFLWGDSHAAALYYGLRHVNPNVTQYTASQCPPLLSIHIASRPNCKSINEKILLRVGELTPAKVVLHATWSSYGDGSVLGAIQNTLEAIHRVSPESQIILIGGVPHWQPDLPTVLLRMGSQLDLSSVLQRENASVAKVLWADNLLKSYVSTSSHVTYLSLLSELCEVDRCISIVNEEKIEPIAWDYAHLTKSGSIFVAKQVIKQD